MIDVSKLNESLQASYEKMDEKGRADLEIALMDGLHPAVIDIEAEKAERQKAEPFDYNLEHAVVTKRFNRETNTYTLIDGGTTKNGVKMHRKVLKNSSVYMPHDNRGAANRRMMQRARLEAKRLAKAARAEIEATKS